MESPNIPPNPLGEGAFSLLVESTYTAGVSQSLTWYVSGKTHKRLCTNTNDDEWTDWVPIATALPPEEIPLNLAAGISTVASHPALFWKNQFGEVTVVVSASKATPFIDTEVIATLPEGFRPKYTMIFPCVASDTRDTGFLYMDRLGAIQVSFGSKSEKNVIACFSL